MSRKSKYLEKLLEVQNQHQNTMHRIVVDAIHEQEGLVNKLYEDEKDQNFTLGERISDSVARFGGSWFFIFIFFTVLISWIVYNVIFPTASFDPYPFILLNLLLSCLAAIQAPIILMSQNRKEARDRKRAQDDYLINLKSELEGRLIDQKLDLFINEQFKDLIEIQKIQIHKLETMERQLKKLSAPIK
jgi:uncharacterized membrane protein